MTDLEAYELLVKYCGGEIGIIRIREMIHLVGVDKAVDNMCKTYAKNNNEISDDFRQWMQQSFDYLSKKMSQPEN